MSEVLRNMEVDLAATVEGHFSPEDWLKIRARAEEEFQRQKPLHPGHELEAWQAVVREFHASRYWGFRANYRPPRRRREKNLGVTMIWMTFNSICFFKVLILWFGQIYTRSDDPTDKWIFFILLALVIANYGFFLWRNRNYQD